jgi:hypothetical protein
MSGVLSPQLIGVGTVAVAVQLPRNGYIENVGLLPIWLELNNPAVAAATTAGERRLVLVPGAAVNVEAMDPQRGYYAISTGDTVLQLVEV